MIGTGANKDAAGCKRMLALITHSAAGDVAFGDTYGLGDRSE